MSKTIEIKDTIGRAKGAEEEVITSALLPSPRGTFQHIIQRILHGRIISEHFDYIASEWSKWKLYFRFSVRGSSTYWRPCKRVRKRPFLSFPGRRESRKTNKFGGWEPTIKAAMDKMEKMKQEATKFLGCRPCEGERFTIGGLRVPGAQTESGRFRRDMYA